MVSTLFVRKFNSTFITSDVFRFSSNKQPFVLKFCFTVYCISSVVLYVKSSRLDILYVFTICKILLLVLSSLFRSFNGSIMLPQPYDILIKFSAVPNYRLQGFTKKKKKEIRPFKSVDLSAIRLSKCCSKLSMNINDNSLFVVVKFLVRGRS